MFCVDQICELQNPKKWFAPASVLLWLQTIFSAPVCNLPQYISFWVLLPTLDVMLHTFWVIDGAECAESKQANCPRFDSIPPIHGGGPTFDLSVRSNFPSLLSEKASPKGSSKATAAAARQTRQIAFRASRNGEEGRRRPNGITKPDTAAAMVSKQGRRASSHI